MPRPPKFFISPEQVTGSSIRITGEDVRHIAAVLRMKSGDELLLSDGQGTEYSVKIASLGRREITTEVVNQATREIRYPLITLGQGLPKSDKMDFIAQKATELGVTSIIPLVTERTIIKITDGGKRISRWQKICREAAMQSNRPDIPKIEPVRTFSNFVETLPHPAEDNTSSPLLLLPWEEGTEPIKNVLRQNSGVRRLIVLIGPEGGFSGQEAQRAREKGFHLVSLGPNILRTETAAIAVLSMILYETSADAQITNSK